MSHLSRLTNTKQSPQKNSEQQQRRIHLFMVASVIAVADNADFSFTYPSTHFVPTEPHFRPNTGPAVRPVALTDT